MFKWNKKRRNFCSSFFLSVTIAPPLCLVKRMSLFSPNFVFATRFSVVVPPPFFYKNNNAIIIIFDGGYINFVCAQLCTIVHISTLKKRIYFRSKFDNQDIYFWCCMDDTLRKRIFLFTTMQQQQHQTRRYNNNNIKSRRLSTKTSIIMVMSWSSSFFQPNEWDSHR